MWTEYAVLSQQEKQLCIPISDPSDKLKSIPSESYDVNTQRGSTPDRSLKSHRKSLRPAKAPRHQPILSPNTTAKPNDTHNTNYPVTIQGDQKKLSTAVGWSREIGQRRRPPIIQDISLKRVHR